MGTRWLTCTTGDISLTSEASGKISLRTDEFTVIGVPEILAGKLRGATTITCGVEDTETEGVYRFADCLYVDNAARETASWMEAPGWLPGLTTEVAKSGSIPTEKSGEPVAMENPSASLSKALARGRRSGQPAPGPISHDGPDLVSQDSELSDAIDDAFAPTSADPGSEVQAGNYRPATATLSGVEVKLYPTEVEARILSMNGFDLDNPSAPALDRAEPAQA